MQAHVLTLAIAYALLHVACASPHAAGVRSGPVQPRMPTFAGGQVPRSDPLLHKSHRDGWRQLGRLLQSRAAPGTNWASTTRPSPISTRRCGSIQGRPRPEQPRRELAAEGPIRQGHRRLQPGRGRRSRLCQGVQQPWQGLEFERRVRQGDCRLQPKPCGSIPSTPVRTTTAASPGTTRASTTRPLPTTTKPCGSIPITPSPTTTAALPGTAKGEYDKAIADFNEAMRLDPNYADRVQQPRPGLGRQRRIRQGHCRFQPGPAAQSQLRLRLQQPRHCLATKASTTRPLPTSTRPCGSIPMTPTRYYNRGVAWNDKGEYDKAIADYDQALRLDPQVRHRVRRPRHRLERERRVRQGHRRFRPGPAARSQRRPTRMPAAALPGTTRASTTRPLPTTTRPCGSIPNTPSSTQPRR